MKEKAKKALLRASGAVMLREFAKALAEMKTAEINGKVGNKGSCRKRFHNEKPETGFEKATKPGLFCAEENGQGGFETEKEVLKLSEKLPRMGKSGQFFFILN